MKQIRFILLLPVILQLTISCSRSGGTDPGPNPPPNPPPAGCKECEYYPVCDGSYFTYIDSVYPAAPVTYTDTLRSLGDTTMGGVVFKKVQRISTRYPSTEYFSCKDGLYLVRGRYGFGSGTIIFLKPNEPVGATWSQTVPGGPTVTFTVMGKGLNMRVNNIDYTGVIWMRVVINGSGSVYSADYYHARSVGNIKFDYGNWNFDPNWYHRNYLQSYFIP